MKAIKYLFVSLLLAGFVTSCSEDTIDDNGIGVITGTVVQNGSNAPIENAKISTNPASSTVFTDEKGKFVLDGIPSGEYSIEAKKEGLLASFEGATVMANTTVNVVFELKKESANNKPPQVPMAGFPSDKSKEIDVNVEFSWSAADLEDDDLTYKLEIRNDKDEKILVFEELVDTVFSVEKLDFNKKYFWQVSASDGVNPEVLSPLFSFKTKEIPNNRILFTRNISGNNVIFARDMEGKEIQLTASNQNSFRPRKNNSVNKIAFLRTLGGQTQLFLMDLDGSGQEQITSSIPVNGYNLDKIDFSWAQDGSTLLYPHFDKLYQVNILGGGAKMIYKTPNGKFITELAVNDNNDLIAVIANNNNGFNAELFTINYLGARLQTILENSSGAVGGLDISLRADKLLFTRDISGYEETPQRQLDSHLFIYHFSDGSITDLSENKKQGTNDLDPKFSPNETEVIFVNTSNDGISPRTIYSVSISKEGDKERTRTKLIENAFMPDWK